MIMRKILMLCLFLGLGFNLLAQENIPSKVIYLKDGSYLKGKIIQEWDDGSLQLQLFDGSEIFLQDELISQVRAEAGKKRFLQSGFSQASKGFYYGVHINFLGANRARQEWEPEARRYGAGAHVVAGYRINRFLGVGLGAGFDGYGDYFVPVTFEVRGFALKKRFSPTYACQVGYGIPVGGEPDPNGEFVDIKRDGGLLVYPSIGMRFETRRDVAFIFDVGVKLQNMTKTRQYNWEWWIDPNIYIDDIWYKSLALRFGWEF
jgi:hypothetical protein